MLINYSISIMKFLVKIVKIVIFRVYVFIFTLESEQPSFRKSEHCSDFKNKYIFLDTPLFCLENKNKSLFAGCRWAKKSVLKCRRRKKRYPAPPRRGMEKKNNNQKV